MHLTLTLPLVYPFNRAGIPLAELDLIIPLTDYPFNRAGISTNQLLNFIYYYLCIFLFLFFFVFFSSFWCYLM